MNKSIQLKNIEFLLQNRFKNDIMNCNPSEKGESNYCKSSLNKFLLENLKNHRNSENFADFTKSNSNFPNKDLFSNKKINSILKERTIYRGLNEYFQKRFSKFPEDLNITFSGISKIRIPSFNMKNIFKEDSFKFLRDIFAQKAENDSKYNNILTNMNNEIKKLNSYYKNVKVQKLIIPENINSRKLISKFHQANPSKYTFKKFNIRTDLKNTNRIMKNTSIIGSGIIAIQNSSPKNLCFPKYPYYLICFHKKNNLTQYTMNVNPRISQSENYRNSNEIKKVSLLNSRLSKVIKTRDQDSSHTLISQILKEKMRNQIKMLNMKICKGSKIHSHKISLTQFSND